MQVQIRLAFDMFSISNFFDNRLPTPKKNLDVDSERFSHSSVVKHDGRFYVSILSCDLSGTHVCSQNSNIPPGAYHGP